MDNCQQTNETGQSQNNESCGTNQHVGGNCCCSGATHRSAPALPPVSPNTPLVCGMGQNTYAMLMHLSQLLNLMIPSGGIIGVILLWALQKDRSTEVDIQGKIILNWIFSALLYLLISIVLIIVKIGILLILVLLALGIIFPIIAAIKANDGIRWRYPFSIEFFKIPK